MDAHPHPHPHPHPDTNGKSKPVKNVINIPPGQERVFPQNSIQPPCTHDPRHANYSYIYGEAPQHSEPSNMEAAINSDDIIRAGGFGATDGLSSVLPIATDSTDFESSLLGMREYEDPQGERHRPGLGWSEDNKESK